MSWGDNITKIKSVNKYAYQVREYTPIPEEGITKKREASFDAMCLLPKAIKDNTYSIYFTENFQIELPIEFQHGKLESEIIKSARILNLKDDWDGEGTKGYKKTTLFNAISFLAKYANWIWDEKDYAIPAPKIFPVSNGAIDIYWKGHSYDLLIHIPEHPNKIAKFYGDDKAENLIQGEFNISKSNQGIFLSLLELD